jgi:hypothetical protein
MHWPLDDVQLGMLLSVLLLVRVQQGAARAALAPEVVLSLLLQCLEAVLVVVPLYPPRLLCSLPSGRSSAQ